jgi:hypothetical protein
VNTLHFAKRKKRFFSLASFAHSCSQSVDDSGVQEYLYKVLVVGDIGTGKTSIIKRFVHNIFSTNYKSTIGVDFALKVIRWDEKTEVRLQLWDIAGQERFGNMTRVYYKEAVGAFIVFDVTRVGTFEAVAKWKSDIDQKGETDARRATHSDAIATNPKSANRQLRIGIRATLNSPPSSSQSPFRPTKLLFLWCCSPTSAIFLTLPTFCKTATKWTATAPTTAS